MSRQCPFLALNSGLFSSTYRCQKTDESVLTGSALYDNYCNNYESGYSQCPHFAPQQSSGGCFLTSACTEAMGLPDDCRELTTLRNFRDHWLAGRAEGKAAIETYYRIAPRIVDAIHADRAGGELLKTLYAQLVCPCVAQIEADRPEAAFELYRETTRSLQTRFGIAP